MVQGVILQGRNGRVFYDSELLYNREQYLLIIPITHVHIPSLASHLIVLRLATVDKPIQRTRGK